MTQVKDIDFMNRALELAELGRGYVTPNPMVGCVIVHNDRIIGEGWHRQYGQAHAEVNAINDVEDQSLLKEATVYVTLEPCSHHGKTPPCADLLVEKAVKRVVIGTIDNNPLVGGKGEQKLLKAGIEVRQGLLEEESRSLNRRFFTAMERHRPYILLKWAQTADGFMARENFDSKWISCEVSRSLVHQWRAEEDTIMVGTNTARYDNPQLNVRDWSGKDPVRLVIDKHLKLDKSLKLFDGGQPTVVYNNALNRQHSNLDFVAVGTEDYIDFILKDLHKRKVQSVMVEGGTQLLSSFIERDLWDEARVFTAPTRFGSGIQSPGIEKGWQSQEQVGVDELNIFMNPEPSGFQTS